MNLLKEICELDELQVQKLHLLIYWDTIITSINTPNDEYEDFVLAVKGELNYEEEKEQKTEYNSESWIKKLIGK